MLHTVYLPTRKMDFTYVLVLPLLWLVLWLSSSDSYGLPGGVLFALPTLFASALLCGKLVQLCGLPPLLGMLLIGFLLRILSDVTSSTIFVVDPTWSSGLRSVALVVILTRAGLGLDLDNLRRLSWSVLRLACLPNLTEALVDAIMAVMLFQMPWLWAFMLGFILSAVSPAVVVPSLLRLKDQHFGTKKGIPDLVLAAASFDDVLSISGFGICLGLSLSDGSSLVWDVLRAPAELATGVIGGILIGGSVWWMTANSKKGIKKETDENKKKNKNNDEEKQIENKVDKTQTTRTENGSDAEYENIYKRTVLLLLFGCFVVFGGKKIHFTGAGALAVIVMGVTYKRCVEKYDHIVDGKRSLMKIKKYLKIIWVRLAQPFLFVLIGASVSISYLDAEFVGLGLLILCVGLVVRLLVTYVCVWTVQFTHNERTFMSMAWLPKATVQAAIGSVALDVVKERGATGTTSNYEAELILGRQVLTLAVLAILVTAPIGAFLIAFFGPKLLEKEIHVEKEEDDEAAAKVEMITSPMRFN